MAARKPQQLVLLQVSDADWRLDTRTREVGRQGVAAAREILRLVRTGDEAARPEPARPEPTRVTAASEPRRAQPAA